jgi:hypothetical protein
MDCSNIKSIITMNDKISICPNCKLRQSCPGETSNLCLYCLEHKKINIFGWDGVILILGFSLWIYLRFVSSFELWFLVLCVSIFGPLVLFNKFSRENYYKYICRTFRKKPSSILRKPYYIVTLLLFITIFLTQPTIYSYFIPQKEITAEFMEIYNKRQEEIKKNEKENKIRQLKVDKIMREYEKTQDINVLKKFSDENKECASKVLDVLIQHKDKFLVNKFYEIDEAVRLSLYHSNGISQIRDHRITKKLILFQDANTSDYLSSLFSGLSLNEISNFEEGQKSVIVINKKSIWCWSYHAEYGTMAKTGDGYKWSYLVYVIDLKNKMVIAKNEFLGEDPPNKAITNSTKTSLYGEPPSLGTIAVWYVSLPLN